MKNYFISVQQFLKEALFPQHCLLCNTLGSVVCDGCAASLPFDPQRPYPNIFSATSYHDQEIRILIHHWKFQHCQDLTPILGDLLVRAVHHFPDIFSTPPLLLPVPLHRKRERIRGFHQTLALTRHLQQRFEWNCSSSALVKVCQTLPQLEAAASERYRNIVGSIQLAHPLPTTGPILLVDDVVTTGSTLNECMRVLTNAGYTNLFALTIAFQPLSQD